MNFEYDFPDDWDSFSAHEKEQWFQEMRHRWMWFLFKKADYENKRQERVDSFRVDSTLT